MSYERTDHSASMTITVDAPPTADWSQCRELLLREIKLRFKLSDSPQWRDLRAQYQALHEEYEELARAKMGVPVRGQPLHVDPLAEHLSGTAVAKATRPAFPSSDCTAASADHIAAMRAAGLGSATRSSPSDSMTAGPVAQMDEHAAIISGIVKTATEEMVRQVTAAFSESISRLAVDKRASSTTTPHSDSADSPAAHDASFTPEAPSPASPSFDGWQLLPDAQSVTPEIGEKDQEVYHLAGCGL